MLRISRLTDYAFILMSRLDEADDEIVSCSSLAEQAPLPLPTVRKVCKKLAKAELLVSHQGAHGGYELAEPLAHITVADVISAMEGPIAVTLCSEGTGECEIERSCPTSQSWKVINAAIQTALDGLTLADMQRPLEPDAILANAGIGASQTGSDAPASPTPGTTSSTGEPRRSHTS